MTTLEIEKIRIQVQFLLYDPRPEMRKKAAVRLLDPDFWGSASTMSFGQCKYPDRTIHEIHEAIAKYK